MIKNKFKEKFNKNETLEQRYDRKSNIFDYIRIIFAILVIIAHSYTIFLGSGYQDPITSKILKTDSIGGIAVIGFLTLSGFMTTQSIIHSKNNREFFLKRILRIFPSLILMLLITILIIAPLGYSAEKYDCFSKSVGSYFWKNLNLFGNTVYSIEGVFENNPYPNVINGSIWTLKHEFIAYIFLIVLSLCGSLKDRKNMLAITLLTTILYVFKFNYKLSVDFLVNIGVFNELSQFIKLLTYFFIGSTIYLYKDKINMSFKNFILACLIFIFGILINTTVYVSIITLPYILLYLGTIKINEKFDIVKKIGDCTYSMYIYAFPIQQLLTYYLNGKVSLEIYILLSIVITTIVSLITTILVDNNIKKIRNKIFKKTYNAR